MENYEIYDIELLKINALAFLALILSGFFYKYYYNCNCCKPSQIELKNIEIV
jgi:hypothetical protein